MPKIAWVVTFGVGLVFGLSSGSLAQDRATGGLKTGARAQSMVRQKLERGKPNKKDKKDRDAILVSQRKGEATLSTVAQIRGLTTEQAAESRPVRITGVITDFSGYKNSFFLQDKTGGISVDRTDDATAHVGDLVELVGVSNAGLFAPCVIASQVTVIGHGPAPPARRITYSDVYGGLSDSEWVEVEGVVHSIQMTKFFDQTLVDLNLQFGSDAISVMLQEYSEADAAKLVDAKVRIRGVSFTDFNNKRQFVGGGLLVPTHDDLEILQRANADPYAAPLAPIRRALQFGESPHRVRVIGTVTYQLPGKVLYLQDGEDGIRVQSLTQVLVQPGQRVEAVGFPSAGEYAPVLQSAVFRVAGREAGPSVEIEPLRVAADTMIVHEEGYDNAPYDQQLVQLQGTVEDSHIEAGQQVWLLRDGDQVFAAHLPVSHSSPGHGGEIGNGSVLLLTGICVVHADTDRNPMSFDVLLRNRRDIVVLKRASWFTPGHTLLVLGAVGGGIILVLLWVIVLRHRVEQQTRMIKESEERFRNMAEHDFLTGLPNRFLLEEHIVQRLAECCESGTKAVVFTIDIDRFKRINDSYGHLIGDECLKIVADRFKGMVRNGDIIARTGGEEFTLVVGGLPDVESARRISSAVLALFKGRVSVEGHAIELTLSLGGAMYPEDALDSGSLRRMSDQALYEAKRTGRNRVVFVSTELLARIEDAAADEALRGQGHKTAQLLLHS